MAEQVAAERWRVAGRDVDLPVVIDGATCAGALFPADPLAIAPHLPHGVTPAAIAGRAVGVLALIRYAPFALGAYDEVALATLVRGPDGRLGALVLDLPVTQPFTREAGEDIWGLPKWLARADATFAPERTALALHDGDRHVLTAEVRPRGPALPLAVPVPTAIWAAPRAGARAGAVLRGRQVLWLHGVRFGRGDAHVELGAHPMAERAAALGVGGRPLLAFTAARLRGRLGTWDAVAPPAAR